MTATQVAKGHLNTLRDGKASLNKQLGLVGSIKQVHAAASHAEMHIVMNFTFFWRLLIVDADKHISRRREPFMLRCQPEQLLLT